MSKFVKAGSASGRIRYLDRGEGIDFRGKADGGTYDKTTLPPAAQFAGRIVFCSNGGAANAACLAYSDGTSWKVVADLTTPVA